MTINRHPSVRFNGAQTMVSAGAYPLTQPITVHMVVQLASTPAADMALLADDGNPTFEATPTAWQADAGAAPVRGGSPDAAVHVLTFQLNPTGTSLVRVDGAQVATATNIGGTLITGLLWLGARSGTTDWLNGELGEVVLYQGTPLTTGQMATNEAYLTAKWAPVPFATATTQTAQARIALPSTATVTARARVRNTSTVIVQPGHARLSNTVAVQVTGVTWVIIGVLAHAHQTGRARIASPPIPHWQVGPPESHWQVGPPLSHWKGTIDE